MVRGMVRGMIRWGFLGAFFHGIFRLFGIFLGFF